MMDIKILKQGNLVSKTNFKNKLITFDTKMLKKAQNIQRFENIKNSNKKRFILQVKECILQVMMDLKTSLYISQYLINQNLKNSKIPIMFLVGNKREHIIQIKLDRSNIFVYQLKEMDLLQFMMELDA